MPWKPIVILLAVPMTAGALLLAAALAAPSTLPTRAVLPNVASGDVLPAPTPTPTPRPQPYVGPIKSIYLASAGILGNAPIEEGDTVHVGNREFFEDPSAPQYIMWYPRFSRPGFPAANTVMAAHVNYVGYGNGPFAGLLRARVDDALYVTMGNGAVYTYTVKSVSLHKLTELDMDAVVFPPLDLNTERVTLISCGGTFIPNPSGIGGNYDSRIVLVAERWLP
jgi:hypothetical protein